MPQVPNEKELSTLAFSDPLTSTTEEKRRNLLFVACASILLTVYDLKLHKTPWLDIEVPDGAPDILRGALSVALLYTLVVFVLYAWTDVHRWYQARQLIQMRGYHGSLQSIHNHLNGIKQLLSDPARSPQAYSEEQRQLANKSQRDASEHLAGLFKELHNMRTSHTVLSTVQWMRLGVVDMGLTLSVAFLAMYKISAAFPPFVLAIFR